MATAISIDNLVKTFGTVRALDSFSMHVQTGEVHGFLGPNGAGKSTAIRVLLGLLRADSGVVKLLGGDPWEDAVELHRRLAYVPGDVSLWPELTGGEAIDILGRLRGGLDEAKRARLIERFDLDPTKKARTYSKGNRQKVAIVAALASDVELLIMDEPTAGLDPLMEIIFQECIKEEQKAGKTILLSSHLLYQVEILCDRVTIIRQGTDVESGTLDELRHLTRTSITAETREDARVLAELPGIHDFVIEDGQVHFDVDTDQIDEAIREISRLGVNNLISRPPTLEQLFMRHYGEELTEAERAPEEVEAVR
ncbi:MAG: ABC transporter ATP-binding protein [Sphaerobacteraceae bacterium]|nr:MAG: ABC transporter ATP-binding protein [Sphaerobacteraceae bacterium]